MSYNLNLRPGDGAVPWEVDVEFGSYSAELKSKLDELDVPGEWLIERDRILVTHVAKALDEPFAETLASTLKNYIEVITPVVDAFEEEQNEEEA